MHLSNNRAPLRALRLEDRTTPSTLVWVGDVNGNWGASVGGNTNWRNATTSTDNVLPQNGDDLTFPTGAGNHTNTNNLSNLVVNSIFLGGTDYVIGGNAITLTSLSDTSLLGSNVVNLPISGAITVAVNVSSTHLTLGGVISGSGTMTKTGGGTLRLSGASANTYTGLTTVSAGTLELGKSVAVTAVPADLTINSGGTVRELAASQIANTSAVTVSGGAIFDLNGVTDLISDLIVGGGSVTIGTGTLLAHPVTMTGGSISSTGVGKLVLQGDLSTNASTATAMISGNLDLNGFTRNLTIDEGNATIDLDISAVISDGGLFKTGAGLLRLDGSSANTYTGLTTVSAGTLKLAKSNGVAAVPQDLTINGGGTVFELGSDQIPDTTIVTVNSLGTLDLSDQFDTIGQLQVNGGIVNIDSGRLTVNGGLTMTGGQFLGFGVLLLASDVVINAASGSVSINPKLDLGGVSRTFTVADGAADVDLEIEGIVQDGGLTKAGPGTLRLDGDADNTDTGVLTVSGGTLELDNFNSVAAPGPLSISAGGAVRELRSNQIADTSEVDVGTGSTFNLNGQTDTIGALSVSGSSVTIGAGTLTTGSVFMSGGSISSTGAGKLVLLGDVTTSSFSQSTATISGTLDLGVFTFKTLIVADGTASPDLDISAAIFNGGDIFEKQGAGTLRLSGNQANIYTSSLALLVSAGTLELDKTGGASAVPGVMVVNGGIVDELAGNQIADTSRVTVNANSTFDLNSQTDTISQLMVNAGVVTIGAGTLTAEAVSMTGGSVASTGAGKLVLLGDVTTNGALGTATISGTLDLGGATRTFTVADGPVNLDADLLGTVQNGGLTKAGSGTLRMAGSSANGYTGLTTVSSGMLLLAKNSGIECVPGNLTINGGIVREAANNEINNASVVTVNSGGTFDLNGQSDTVGPVTVLGGTFKTSGTPLGRLTTDNTSFNSTATLTMNLLDASNSDRVDMNGTVALGGALQLTAASPVALGTSIRIINNDGTDAVTGTFTNLPQGATFFAGNQLFAISYTGGTGNDVVVTRTGGPTVLSTQVNDGAAQRSRITSLQVTFSAQVTFAGTVASAFMLTRNGGGAVAFAASASVVNGVTVVSLNSFTGSETEFGSLKDGRYTLTALAGQITFNGLQLDGNGDGTAGDNLTFGDNQGLFRYFGDVNGDQVVNGFDLGFFRNTFGTAAGDPNYLSYFDFNGDGVINGFDLGQFRTRFGTLLP
jgi:autotransporter-associated beta strand protein